MSSLLQSQISFPLEACLSSNKNTTKTRPCIAQLYNKKTHFINLVSKSTLLPNLRTICPIEKWKARDSNNESSDVSPEFLPASPSPVHIVHEFYEAFNKKDTETLKQIKQLLSPKCVYQDLLFYTAYEGQEVFSIYFSSFMITTWYQWNYWWYFHSNILFLFIIFRASYTFCKVRWMQWVQIFMFLWKMSRRPTMLWSLCLCT